MYRIYAAHGRSSAASLPPSWFGLVWAGTVFTIPLSQCSPLSTPAHSPSIGPADTDSTTRAPRPSTTPTWRQVVVAAASRGWTESLPTSTWRGERRAQVERERRVAAVAAAWRRRRRARRKRTRCLVASGGGARGPGVLGLGVVRGTWGRGASVVARGILHWEAREREGGVACVWTVLAY